MLADTLKSKIFVLSLLMPLSLLLTPSQSSARSSVVSGIWSSCEAWLAKPAPSIQLAEKPMEEVSKDLSLAVQFAKRFEQARQNDKDVFSLNYSESFEVFKKLRRQYNQHILTLNQAQTEMRNRNMLKQYPGRFAGLNEILLLASKYSDPLNSETAETLTYAKMSFYSELMTRIISIWKEDFLKDSEHRVDRYSVEDIQRISREQPTEKSHFPLLDYFEKDELNEVGYSSLKADNLPTYVSMFTHPELLPMIKPRLKMQLRELPAPIRFQVEGFPSQFAFLEAATYNVNFETIYVEGFTESAVDSNPEARLNYVLGHDRAHEFLVAKLLYNQVAHYGLDYLYESQVYMRYLTAFINHIIPPADSGLTREQLFAALTAIVFNFHHEESFTGTSYPHPSKGHWKGYASDILKATRIVAEDKDLLVPMSWHKDEPLAALGPDPRRALKVAVKLLIEFNKLYRRKQVDFLTPYLRFY